MLKNLLALLLFLGLTFAIEAPSHAESMASKRGKILSMRNDVLTRLFQEQPQTRREIADAAGYAVFSNIGVNALFFAASGGNGVAHHNHTGRDTFMNMASAGVGLGLGIKDFRAVFVFHTTKAYKNFIAYGWDFSGQADAAAKSRDKGEGTSVAVTAVPGVSVYQLTESGIALQATLQGTKYWRDNRLN